MDEPFEYDQIFINEAVFYLEQKWCRCLTDHEKNIVKEAYRFGRLVEMQSNLVKGNVLEVKDGVVQIDFDNPEHMKIYEKWIED